MNQLVTKCKRELVELYKHALENVKPDKIIKDSVRFEQGTLTIRDPVNVKNKPLIYDLSKRRLHVIGGGKCAIAMARGLAELATQARVTNLFSHGCLSVPVISKPNFDSDQSLQDLLNSIKIDCKFGSKNNLPDEDSVDATRHLLHQTSEACKVDLDANCCPLFIVLISGGGSACLTSPKHISLECKSTIIKQLVQAGADIVELNTVRRCLSNIKGGNLARHILSANPNAQIVSLIISDVIGDPIEYIASGPTCLDGNADAMQQAMIKIMQKYHLEVPKISTNDHHHQQQSQQQHSITSQSESVINRVIGNNTLALNSLVVEAAKLGFNIRMLGNSFDGETKQILDKILAAGAEAQVSGANGAQKTLVVCGGEATVRKLEDESWGLGGRTQEMALDYIIHKLSSPEVTKTTEVDVFLAGSTDGQDGPTDVAGCLASFHEWSISKPFGLDDALQARRSHDSYKFWQKHKSDWLIRTGPTGTNVMDLYLLSYCSEEAG